MNFIEPDLQLVNELLGVYSPALIVLSVIIAVVASYSAFLFSQQYYVPSQTAAHRLGWLAAGSISLGGGIWAVHFVGMLAYKLPIQVSYDAKITFLTVIPAILAGLIVLKSGAAMSLANVIIRSIVLGACIGVMHYSGMAAMHLDAGMWYSPSIFILSIVVAVLLSASAIFLKQWASSHYGIKASAKKEIFFAALLMGMAISGMHYTGMSAVHFTPGNMMIDHSEMLAPMMLATLVGLVLLGVLILSVISILLSRRFSLLNELKLNQFRLIKILDSTVDALIILNRNGDIELFNTAAENIFGYDEAGIVGQNIFVLLEVKDDSDELVKIKNTIENVNSCIINNSNHLCGLSKSGCLFSIDFAINSVDMEEDVQFICVIRDITERKEAEIELRDSAACVAAIVDTVPDGIFTVNEDGTVRSMNPSAENIFGYFVREVEGKHIDMLLFDAMDDYISRGHRGGRDNRVTGVHVEVKGQRKDGSTFPVELSVNEFYLSNNHFFTCVTRDITVRKKAKQELERHQDHLQVLVAMATIEVNAIVQTAVNAVITADQNGIIQIFNPAAEKMFGWSSDEVVGSNVSILVPGINSATHDGYISRYLETRDPHIIGIGREVEALRKNGEKFPAHLAVGHSELASDKQLFVAFITDITSQKTTEKELLNAKDNAEQAARAKANFLANMSHEIRTPMNAIIGFSEVVLQDESLSPDSKQHVSTILNSGGNLLGIINDILDVSKIEAGKVNLEQVCFHLPNAVQDSLHTLEFKAAEKGLELRFMVSPKTPLRVMGDPARLRQVILNLVGNAIKFTHSGSVTLTMSPDQSTDHVRISVSDTGIGMSPDQVKKVFDAFSQADSSTNRRFGGTGLGTTISKQIVELMHGKIWAESIKGEGSIFHFTAELKEADDIANCLFEDGSFIQEDYRSPRAFKVLLAEDMPENATFAVLRLEQQGHQVTWVENGQLVVDAISNDDYDIVLMDIQMPEIDGLRATSMIRALLNKQAAETPIIALTASVMREDRQECFNAGMNAIVGKPIDFSDLLSTMERLVNEGRGEVRDEQIFVPLIDKTKVDFSPLNDLVNYEKGLSVWRDPLVYANALTSFSRENENKISEIKTLLDGPISEVSTASVIIHTLKGLLGNLAIDEMAKRVAELDSLLKVDDLNTARDKLPPLVVLMSQVTSAIKELALPHVTDRVVTAFDPDAVEKILSNLLIALDELNPDAASPYLLQLVTYIDDAELSAIRRNIDNFEFEIAMDEVIKLSQRLNITVKKGLSV